LMSSLVQACFTLAAHEQFQPEKALSQLGSTMHAIIRALANDRDQKGMTPLMVAAANGQTECLQYLLHLGADPRMQVRSGRLLLVSWVFPWATRDRPFAKDVCTHLPQLSLSTISGIAPQPGGDMLSVRASHMLFAVNFTCRGFKSRQFPCFPGLRPSRQGPPKLNTARC
jgi:hypothetical protein